MYPWHIFLIQLEKLEVFFSCDFPPKDGLVMKTSVPLLCLINLPQMGIGQSFCIKSRESQVAVLSFLGCEAHGRTGIVS